MQLAPLQTRSLACSDTSEGSLSIDYWCSCFSRMEGGPGGSPDPVRRRRDGHHSGPLEENQHPAALQGTIGRCNSSSIMHQSVLIIQLLAAQQGCSCGVVLLFGNTKFVATKDGWYGSSKSRSIFTSVYWVLLDKGGQSNSTKKRVNQEKKVKSLY